MIAELQMSQIFMLILCCHALKKNSLYACTEVFLRSVPRKHLAVHSRVLLGLVNISSYMLIIPRTLSLLQKLIEIYPPLVPFSANLDYRLNLPGNMFAKLDGK